MNDQTALKLISSINRLGDILAADMKFRQEQAMNWNKLEGERLKLAQEQLQVQKEEHAQQVAMQREFKERDAALQADYQEAMARGDTQLGKFEELMQFMQEGLAEPPQGFLPPSPGLILPEDDGD
jgi:hypothetical protein